ncbi:MAG: hypothetical protein GEU80_06255 [Dehalococcoidia bacterium]|nr:hypothetical protein [Dehalococcoidia bacterium]
MAVVLGLFVVGGVLCVDIAQLYDTKSRVQGAADFAALAAAQDLPRSIHDPDYAAKLAIAEDTARRYLVANGFDPAEDDIDATVLTGYNGEADTHRGEPDASRALALRPPIRQGRGHGDRPGRQPDEQHPS